MINRSWQKNSWEFSDGDVAIGSLHLFYFGMQTYTDSVAKFTQTFAVNWVTDFCKIEGMENGVMKVSSMVLK